MNLDVLSALQLTALEEPSTLAQTLSRILTSGTQARLTIKGARDRFSEVNRRAKQGEIQVIAGLPGEETILVSVRDLAAMVHAMTRGITLAQVLDAAGFEPVPGPRLILKEGLKPARDLSIDDRPEGLSSEFTAAL